ncbi:replication initiator [Nocardia sp. NPDC051981]|uniref:replication initiator n=1 Tax=Nocardia sp. NPDC051981 TaxID=3155417 RepID=UPI00341F78BC
MSALQRLGPSLDEITLATAQRFGVCIRPVVLQRLDLHTGRMEWVSVPCGHTLESVCPPCARKAKLVRLTQCREGWHLTEEPEPPRARVTFDQTGMVGYRADLMAVLTEAREEGLVADETELRKEIGWVDAQLIAMGMRGTPPALENDEPPADSTAKRSTRRRQDTPALPRLPITDRTLGHEFAGKYTPSMMITLTLDSYGKVHRDDGSPIDARDYDYSRAAWDAIAFSRLFSRFIDNLRRAVGWDVQYFASVEPQRRGAPHVHVAIRGAIPHKIIRQVAAATYHQVWWPDPGDLRYDPADPARAPMWDKRSETFVDPDTGAVLQSWDEAIEETFAEDAQPAHVARFGAQVHSRGILGGTEEANRHIDYVCKYLHKSVDQVLEATSARARTHYERLHETLCVTPCSPRCAVWLLYGIVPKDATGKTIPGRCKARAHRRDTLGLPGNRVLTSRRWTGKTVGDHRADRLEFVRRTLEFVGIDKPAPDPRRYAWSLPAPGTRLPPRRRLLLAAIVERLAWRAEYDRAYLAAGQPPDLDVAATGETGRGGGGD